jgi:hypothetical protein
MSVAVIVQSNADAAADALAALASCHEALLGLLSTLDGINVIAGDPVAAFEGTGLSPFEIARALGAGSVLTLELSGLTPSCNARMSDAASGARIFGATRFPDPGRIEPNEWDGFARGIAMSVNQAILMDEAQIARQAYEMVLNPALPDRQRASALSSLEPGRGTHPELIDSAILAAAIQLGTASADPSARESVWNSLRGLKDPELMQPLLFSLGYDDFADVRREAAMALHHFADEPEVRAALQQAIEQDPSQQREQPCCILSVREAAERALMSDAELRASIERTIMNAALPADSRIAPLRASPDGRVMAFPLNAALTRSVFEIGLASSAENRAFAWFLLSRGPVNPEFVPTLLDDLANHADILVRSNAASALGRYIDDPDVAAALERAAAEDTAERVQAVAGALLDRAEP